LRLHNAKIDSLAAGIGSDGKEVRRLVGELRFDEARSASTIAEIVNKIRNREIGSRDGLLTHIGLLQPQQKPIASEASEKRDWTLSRAGQDALEKLGGRKAKGLAREIARFEEGYNRAVELTVSKVAYYLDKKDISPDSVQKALLSEEVREYVLSLAYSTLTRLDKRAMERALAQVLDSQVLPQAPFDDILQSREQFARDALKLANFHGLPESAVGALMSHYNPLRYNRGLESAREHAVRLYFEQSAPKYVVILQSLSETEDVGQLNPQKICALDFDSETTSEIIHDLYLMLERNQDEPWRAVKKAGTYLDVMQEAVKTKKVNLQDTGNLHNLVLFMSESSMDYEQMRQGLETRFGFGHLLAQKTEPKEAQSAYSPLSNAALSCFEELWKRGCSLWQLIRARRLQKLATLFTK